MIKEHYAFGLSPEESIMNKEYSCNHAETSYMVKRQLKIGKIPPGRWGLDIGQVDKDESVLKSSDYLPPNLYSLLIEKQF